MSGARALTLLCHWGNCKTKEDDIRHTRMQPHIQVRLKVCLFSVPTCLQVVKTGHSHLPHDCIVFL